MVDTRPRVVALAEEEGTASAAFEEVPLLSSSNDMTENAINIEAHGVSASGVCRICLEDAPANELEEPCSCSGTLQVRSCFNALGIFLSCHSCSCCS